jgi:hypothetical protein
MKRMLLSLAALGILGMGATQAFAHDWYGGCHHGHGYYGSYYVKRLPPPPPRFVVPPPPPPVIVGRPAYGYRYYAPQPGIYYQNRGISIGIGF